MGSNPTLSAILNSTRPRHRRPPSHPTRISILKSNGASIQGEVSEWLKVQHWKCCVVKATAGSNPALSASDVPSAPTSPPAGGVLMPRVTRSSPTPPGPEGSNGNEDAGARGTFLSSVRCSRPRCAHVREPKDLQRAARRHVEDEPIPLRRIVDNSADAFGCHGKQPTPRHGRRPHDYLFASADLDPKW